jgi:hypothetical protein
VGGGLAYAASRGTFKWSAAAALASDERRVLGALREAEQRLGLPGLATPDSARRIAARAPRILAETPVPLDGAPVDLVVWALRTSTSAPHVRALVDQLSG